MEIQGHDDPSVSPPGLTALLAGVAYIPAP